MEFCKLIKEEREKQYESSKRFIEECNINCSYFYYTKIEKGQIPHIELTLEILKKLGIPLKRGLYSWARSQMPDEETRSIFSEMAHSVTIQRDPSKTSIIKKSQKNLLESEPLFFEILVYLSLYSENSPFSSKFLAKKFKIELPQMNSLLAELNDYDLIQKENDLYKSKDHIYIPHSSEFMNLRNINFKRAVQKFFDDDNNVNQNFKITTNKLVSPEQVLEIEEKILALLNWVLDLSEDSKKKKIPFTVGVFSGLRKFGNE